MNEMNTKITLKDLFVFGMLTNDLLRMLKIPKAINFMYKFMPANAQLHTRHTHKHNLYICRNIVFIYFNFVSDFLNIILRFG